MGNFNDRSNHPRGFTPIEMIVVFVMVLVLAATAIHMLKGYIAKARKTALVLEEHAVLTACQAYVTENYSGSSGVISTPKTKKLGNASETLPEYAEAMMGKQIGTVMEVHYDRTGTVTYIVYLPINSDEEETVEYEAGKGWP